MMFCGVCEILSDEFDPGEWGSSDRALVRGQVELQGFLCGGVFVQTKDMSQECQTPSFDSFCDGYLFCDVVEFLTADDFWVLYIQ